MTAPANTANVDADSLLIELARRIAQNEGVSTDENTVANIANALRWEPRLDRKPPAVVIMRRGKKIKGVSNVVAVISKEGDYADLYPSWVPVLAKRQAKQIANAVSRVSHDDLPVGNLPERVQ